jgi:hypothetical protein
MRIDNMKRLTMMFCFVICLLSGTGFAFEMKVATGFNYDWWDDTKDNTGRQFYIPMRLEARQNDFYFTILTGYAYTHFDGIPSPINFFSFSSQPEKEEHSLTHLLDTKLNFSYEIVGKLPVDLLIGLDFNLPTGKRDLNVKEMALIMDPDLISITQFGEGYNINPTLSLAKGWGKWVAGISVGYLWRGKYDFGFVEEVPPHYTTHIKDYNPGDIFNGNAEIRYDFSPQWSARLFGNYTWYDESKWRQEDSYNYIPFSFSKQRYQEGPLYIAGSGVQHKEENWEAGLTIRGLFREKSKYPIERFIPGIGTVTTLSPEPRNGHGDEWIADLAFNYFLSKKVHLKSFLQGLLITKNNYPYPMGYTSIPNRFVGKREKITLGLGIKGVLHPKVEADFNVKGFLMHDEEAFIPEFPFFKNERTYRGLSVGGQLIGRF